MTKEEIEHILAKIDNEGFDYCFINYSSWDEIKDKTFHHLTDQYIEAQADLEKYIKQEALRHGVEDF